ncbi:hypothetical protein BC833DRAFT_571228 [Globomyces pollinis-pini]|nr:hypothetical protein BC833DRAFT_571228 [Globomyces pollinis-pini]
MDKPRTVPPTPHLHPSMQSKDGFNHYKSHSYNQLKSFIPQPKSALVTSHESSPSTSNLESRARNIILSNIPIQESKNGRVRVIRQNQNIQPVDQTEPDSLISQHEPLASSLESSKDNYSPKIVEPIGFMRSVKHVNTGYSYKPPAAAKYYLW